MRIKFGLSLLLLSFLLCPGCLFHKKSKPASRATPIRHAASPATTSEVNWDGTTNSAVVADVEPEIKMELVTNVEELLNPAPATNAETLPNPEPVTNVATLPNPELVLPSAPVTNVEAVVNPERITNTEVVVTPPEPMPVVNAETNIVQPSASSDKPAGKMIVTPDKMFTGTVTFMNSAAKFVVLTFPIGHLPTQDQSMNVYRRGLKVGEVKITGPQKDDNVVADLVNGEAQLGDDVR